MESIEGQRLHGSGEYGIEDARSRMCKDMMRHNFRVVDSKTRSCCKRSAEKSWRI
jgi:hypothetical protein